MVPKSTKDHVHIKEITILTFLLILLFSIAALYLKDTMTFYMCLAILPLLAFFYFSHKELHITVHLFIFGFILFFLHFIGSILGLYEMSFLGLGYDNLTHIYGAFVLTLVAYNFIRAHWKETPNVGNFYLFLTIVFVGLGIGALLEIFELGAVLLFDAPEVGGYLNNAFDLVRDGIGAVIGATLMIYLHHK